ncbi:hypothetical protein [Amphibiibacter pelophylacis]|uniref:Uncharacterized protein n=1 Tax=Amphibiibacter pelophylacis TaxID=1799477 RepID=A0ACC6P5R1_9BURK
MNYWRRFDSWLSNPRVGPGEFFDMQSYKGLFRIFLFSMLMILILWNSYDFFIWFDQFFWGIHREINNEKKEWRQILSLIIGLPLMGFAIVGAVVVLIRRRKSQRQK